MDMPREILDGLPDSPGSIMQRAIDVALSIGEDLRSQQFSRMKVDLKRRADYVTEHDIRTEAALRQAFSEIFPEAIFFGEEGDKPPDEGFVWFVDPIDGTTNFIRGVGQYAISVSLYHTGLGPVFGFVYSPKSRELWYAVRGGGAFKVCYRKDPEHLPLLPEHLPRRIQVSDHGDYRGSLVLFGTPYNKKLLDVMLPIVQQLGGVIDDIRRMGVSSLDLCYVAEGCAEMYFEVDMHIWDVSAGALIVTEAGGFVLPENLAAQRMHGIQIIASNGSIPIDLVRGITDLDLSQW